MSLIVHGQLVKLRRPSAPTARLLDRDPKDIDQMISLNLNGVLYCCHGPVGLWWSGAVEKY